MKNLTPEQVAKLAKKGYDAYRSASGGVSYYTQQPLPEYDTQPAPVKAAWEAAVLSVQPEPFQETMTEAETAAGNLAGNAGYVQTPNGAACAASPAAAAVDPSCAGLAGNGTSAPAGAAETGSPNDATATPDKAAA